MYFLKVNSKRRVSAAVTTWYYYEVEAIAKSIRQLNLRCEKVKSNKWPSSHMPEFLLDWP